MLALRHMGAAAIAVAFVLATAVDSADARRGGGGGMRASGFSGGGVRAGSIGGGGRGFANVGVGRPSHPIARPPGAGAGWGNRPGYGPGYGYRPGYGWGAAAALGAGVAYSAANYGYGGYDGYGYYDDASYAAPTDPIAECARRFKTYDAASQTYVKRKGVLASCP